jgi:hypothetical protein
MSLTQILPARKSEDLLSPLVSTFLIVLLLFYVDEGYYNFNWMADWGNWFVFGIYVLIIFPVQWAVSHFIFHKLSGWKKTAAMVGVTFPASILFIWLVF